MPRIFQILFAIATVMTACAPLKVTDAPPPTGAPTLAPTLPPAPTPAPISTSPLLYVSGTMHIENNPQRQPQNIDAVIEFFRRATATGMKWSIGADIGWLEGEPRVGEVIRATEALGVEWDVHAHSAADRLRCVAKITALGGHPNTVVSGLTVAEIDALRTSQTSNGVTWTPAVLYGLVLQTGHGFGSDVNDVGV